MLPGALESLREVADLYSQPDLLGFRSEPIERVPEPMPTSNPSALLELAMMAAEAFGHQPPDYERQAWACNALEHLRSLQQVIGMIEDLPTTMAFLTAAYWQAQAAFADGAWEFPSEITEHDGRAVTVREWCKTLPSGARLLDAGCGKGRYLLQILTERSDLQLVGVDLAQEALDQLPGSVEGRSGHLLKLPAVTAEFDAVLCVEALEHALLPRQAADELCRVVRPGGSILIIDKDRRYQAHSQSQPWEAWFSVQDFQELLGPACDQVTCARVRHQSACRKRLFLTATAIRGAADS